MERHGLYYEVRRYKGFSGLVIHHDERVEDVVNDINNIVATAKARGYHNDEKWLIICVEWVRVWDDDGVFLHSEEKRRSIALYDNGVVTMFDSEEANK